MIAARMPNFAEISNAPVWIDKSERLASLLSLKLSKYSFSFEMR